jgi:hypothetical protein
MTPKSLSQCRICLSLRVSSPSDARISPALHSYVDSSPCSSAHLTLPLIHSLYSISTYIPLNHHKDMNPLPPPPRSSLPTEPAGAVQERQHPTEDDLLGQELQPSSSPKPLSETSSSQGISLHTRPSTSLAQPPAQDVGVRIHDHLSTDDLFEQPQTTSPDPANPSLTKSSPSQSDELIYTMPQYQPVSAGSTASPRTMSQVSPGFIFVNFLSLSVCCFFFTPSLAPSILHLVLS